MQLVHLTYASTDRSSLFPSVELRRRALHTLARVVGTQLVLFSIVDDHLHVVAFVDDRGGAVLAGRLHLALRRVTAVELSRAHIKPVSGRRHLQSILRYLLVQPEHHGLSASPQRWEGSCLPDLISARVLPGTAVRAQLREALPRAKDAELLAMVGLIPDHVEPASLEEVRDLGAVALVGACQRATAAPAPWGRSHPAVHARAAAIRIGQAAGFSSTELARACRVTPRAARYRGRVAIPDDICWAARRQLRLHHPPPGAANPTD